MTNTCKINRHFLLFTDTLLIMLNITLQMHVIRHPTVPISKSLIYWTHMEFPATAITTHSSRWGFQNLRIIFQPSGLINISRLVRTFRIIFSSACLVLKFNFCLQRSKTYGDYTFSAQHGKNSLGIWSMMGVLRCLLLILTLVSAFYVIIP